jgi:hypothetical protein
MENVTLSNKGKILEFLFGIFLIFVGAFIRLLPHPPNFTPIGAIALFGGVYLSKWLAISIPISAMIISDVFLVLLRKTSFSSYPFFLMLSVYGSCILCVFFGLWLKKRKRWYFVFGTSFLCSVSFFLITNFGVWAFTNWYPKNIRGLIECYIMAISFFKNTLLGDFFYVSLFFGSYELIDLWIRKKFVLPQQV